MEGPVVARDLFKTYRNLAAVRGISFTVESGECFGFLGPNGAGKTSILRMIGCVSPVTAGDLWVQGLSVRTEERRIKALLGVIPQEESLDPDLTVSDNLAVYAGYFGMPRAQARERARESLEEFQLADRAGSQIDELSGGMKRRLLIARGLINRPPIVLLDEPTTGLDPQARHAVWRSLRGLKRAGVTLVLTTHYMEEAAVLCDRIIVMHEGQIVDEGTPGDLIGRHAGETVIEVHSENRADIQRAAAVLTQAQASVETTDDALYAFGLPVSAIAAIDLDQLQTVVRPANLEDVFLRLTGRGLQD